MRASARPSRTATSSRCGPHARQPPPEVARPRRRQGVQEGLPRRGPVRARGHRRLVAQHHAGAGGRQRDLDLADRVRQEGQRLEPPVHDLAAQGRELLVPRGEEPLGVGPAHQVAEEARPLLERQPIAPARLARARARASRSPRRGRRAGGAGRPRATPGRTPRSSRRRPTGRASLAPRPLPRARAARAARRASGSPRRARPPPWPGRRHPSPRQSASFAVRKDRPVSRT